MNAPTSTQPTDPHAVKKAKLENWNLRVGMFVAVITLLLAVAGFLGIKLNNSNNENEQIQGAVQTLEIVVSTQGVALTQNSADLQSASSELGSLSSASSSQASAIASLSAQLADQQLTTPTPPTTTPVGPVAGTVRHEDTIVLNGEGIDLDAPSTDPTWGANGDRNLKDLFYNANKTLYSPPTSGVKVLDAGAKASLQTCQSPGYISNSRVNIGQLPDGGQVCARSAEGRYAAMELVGVATDPNVQLHIITFEK